MPHSEEMMITQGVNSHRIENWLTAQAFGNTRAPGPIVLNLCHLGLDEAARLVRTWQIDGMPERSEFRDLVAEVDTAAMEDCEHLGSGTQRYLLRATTSQGRELGSLSLRYVASALIEGGFADSEPATPRGQVAQAMRHTDAAYRTLATGMGLIVDTLSRRLSHYDGLIDKLLQNQVNFAELAGQMADRRFEREVVADQKKRDDELEFHRRIAELDRNHALMKLGIERVGPLIPMIANRLAGKQTGAGPNGRDELLASILSSITPEQFTALQGVLSQEQLVGLQELLDAVTKARGGGCVPEAGAPSAAPGSGETLSRQSALIALDHLKKNLLPWAWERMKAGMSFDLRAEKPTETRVFELFVRSLSPEQYEMLSAQNSPLPASDRDAFVRIAEMLGLVPETRHKAPERPASAERKP